MPCGMAKKKKKVNIILANERLSAFLLRLGTQEVCPLSLLLFNTVVEVLVKATRQEKEIKGIPSGKEEISCPSLLSKTCPDDMIIYGENPKELTNKFI